MPPASGPASPTPSDEGHIAAGISRVLPGLAPSAPARVVPINRQMQLSAPVPVRDESARLTRIGHEVIAGAERRLTDLIFNAPPELFELGPGQHVELHGHTLARAYVAKAMRVVYEVLGIRPERQPEAALGKIINRHVCTVYAHFSVQDVYEAFIQAIAGNFDVDVAHWGEVNLAYLNTVWRAYDAFAYRRAAPAPQRLLSGPGAARLAYLKKRPGTSDAIRELLQDYYQHRLDGNPKPASLMVLNEEIYKFLEELKLLTITDEEMQGLRQTALKRVAVDEKLSEETARVKYPARCWNATYRFALALQLNKWEQLGWSMALLNEELDRACYLSPSTHEELYQLCLREYGQWPPAK